VSCSAVRQPGPPQHHLPFRGRLAPVGRSSAPAKPADDNDTAAGNRPGRPPRAGHSLAAQMSPS